MVNRFFKDLNTSAGIDLENIVYYRDETHYFVMTAKKHSLLYKGVLLQVWRLTLMMMIRLGGCGILCIILWVILWVFV